MADKTTVYTKDQMTQDVVPAVLFRLHEIYQQIAAQGVNNVNEEALARLSEVFTKEADFTGTDDFIGVKGPEGAAEYLKKVSKGRDSQYFDFDAFAVTEKENGETIYTIRQVFRGAASKDGKPTAKPALIAVKLKEEDGTLKIDSFKSIGNVFHDHDKAELAKRDAKIAELEAALAAANPAAP